MCCPTPTPEVLFSHDMATWRHGAPPLTGSSHRILPPSFRPPAPVVALVAHITCMFATGCYCDSEFFGPQAGCTCFSGFRAMKGTNHGYGWTLNFLSAGSGIPIGLAVDLPRARLFQVDSTKAAEFASAALALIQCLLSNRSSATKRITCNDVCGFWLDLLGQRRKLLTFNGAHLSIDCNRKP